jgi:archaellum component FlaC
MNAAQYKNEIAKMKAQELDITDFENKLGKYKDKISGLSDKAKVKFNAAINEIDKIILKLNDVKEKLLDSEGFLGDAYKQVDEMSIKKLTRGNPTLTRMFKELGQASDS